MRTFVVAAANGKLTKYTGEYKIEEAGVLTVLPDKGNPVIYSPVGWNALEILDAPQGSS